MMATPRQLPPGFRFHPTDEELVVQYLRRKALSRPLPAAVISDVHDAAVFDPWDLPGAGEGEAYFFSFRQLAPASGRKGGEGCRRRAGSGYWKPTGAEKPVFLRGFGCGGGGKQQQQQQHLVGVKTTLVFVRAKPPSRTGWVMHEYRLAAAAAVAGQKKGGIQSCMAHQPGEWVVCRIFLKNNRSSRRRLGDADGQTPVTGVHGGVQGGGHHRQLQPSPSPSSSSCVTAEISDEEEEEVSSGSINCAPAASQREA